MSLRSIAAIMDPVVPANSLKSLCAQHFSETPVMSLAELERRHTHPQNKTDRFFVFNTFLMDIPGRGRKPAVEYRDAEIGTYISARAYDVVCLSELWHKEERVDLLNALDFVPEVAHRSGRGGLTNVVPMMRSSGLLTMSRNMRLVADHFHEYQNESGSDKNAAKGCLLTVHESGYSSINTPSSINVYSTHLNASGNAKYAQVLEFANFIWQTRDKVQGDRSRPGRPGLNACILAGDFNIDRFTTHRLDTAHYEGIAEQLQSPGELIKAITNKIDENGNITDEIVESKSGFQLLSDVLTLLGFKDLWKLRNGTPGYTSDLTNQGVSDVIARPATDDATLCEDTIDTAALRGLHNKPSAIDHIFVTPTSDMLPFTIDFTRPRRPRTPRAPGSPQYGEGGLTFMSDHLGIETTIIIAPK